ncbi:MAG TPA: DUF6134 family protein [Pirellulales bacterium]|nr:DUF6134 family protein [Pirellulales bacterium]
MSIAAAGFIAAGPLFCLICFVAQAADGPTSPVVAEEFREFEVFVKDKPAGKSTIRITETADGATRVDTEASVKLDYFVYVYRYEFHGRETWREGRLVSTENRATDDGKKLIVRARLGAGGSTIETNGKARAAPRFDMTTNYWRAPDMSRRSKQSFMNADQGTLHSVEIRAMGAERVMVDRRRIDCAHLRVSGEIEADLWFDDQDRIVGRKTIEDGYPTELRLVRVSRSAARTATR